MTATTDLLTCSNVMQRSLFSRFVVSLERLRERPWVTEKPWKTFSHRKFVKKTEKPIKSSLDKKNNSKQTNCMIGKYFFVLTIKWFVWGIMFHIILHIIVTSCTSFSDFVFSENQPTCILFNYLRISILYLIIF